MTTATLPTNSPRVELLRRFGVRPGGLAPVRALVNALEQALHAGCAETFWAALYPDEQDYILNSVKHPGVMQTWRMIHGDIAPQSTVYVPPNNWYTPRLKVNPLRIRGGLVAVVKPIILLLPAPRIAGLLPARCMDAPDNLGYRNETSVLIPPNPVDRYWSIMSAIEREPVQERET